MLLATVADQYIVAATAATLSWQPTDSDGDPDDPGTVTVGVSSSDGTEVVAAGTSTSGTGSAVRTVTLTPAQTAAVDWLYATWTVSAVTVATTVHEVIGVPLVTRADFQLREPKMAGIESAKFNRERREVFDLFHRATRRGLVPRFAVERIPVGSSRSDLVLRYPDLRSVVWATHTDGFGTTTDITVTSAGASAAGIATLTGSDYWPCGTIEVGYRYGYDRPPDDVRGAAARAIRAKIGQATSTIPDRATTYSDGQGGTTRLATPGLGPFITGIPEVDEVLMAHRWHPPAVA